MTEVLRKTVELAAVELGDSEVRKLAGVMRALCLDLSDIEARYYVVFDESGGVDFSTSDPCASPVLTITTSAEVFHGMAMGESNPAREFALRKVKLSGVAVTGLAQVGGNLIDTLFACYRASV